MQGSRTVETFWVTARPDARSISLEDSEAQLRSVWLDTVGMQLLFSECSTSQSNSPSQNAQLGKITSSVNIRQVCRVDVKSAFRKSGELDFAIVIMYDNEWTWLRHTNRDVVFNWAECIRKLSRIVVPTVPQSNQYKSLQMARSMADLSPSEVAVKLRACSDNVWTPNSSLSSESDSNAGVKKLESQLKRLPESHEDATTNSQVDMFSTQMRTVRYAGYALKEGNKVRNWKRRFFVLDNTALFYFASHELVTRESVKGYLLLADVRFVDEANASRALLNSTKPNMLQVVTTRRTYFMQTDLDETKFEWIKQLHAAMETCTTRVASLPGRAYSFESVSLRVDDARPHPTDRSLANVQLISNASCINLSDVNASSTVPSSVLHSAHQNTPRNQEQNSPKALPRLQPSNGINRLLVSEVEREYLRKQTVRVQQRLAVAKAASPRQLPTNDMYEQPHHVAQGDLRSYIPVVRGDANLPPQTYTETTQPAPFPPSAQYRR